MIHHDLLDRENVGPWWEPRHGRVAMHRLGDRFAMAVRNTAPGSNQFVYEDAGVLWYAPAESDNMEVTFGVSPGPGSLAVAVCCSYLMDSWMGVAFTDDTVTPVLGDGPISFTPQADPVSEVIDPDAFYRLRYEVDGNVMRLLRGEDQVLEWVDTEERVFHSMGHRYVGAAWNASFADPGPLLTFWKVMAT